MIDQFFTIDRIYIGIDPGVSGGVAWKTTYENMGLIGTSLQKMPETERDLCDLFDKKILKDQYSDKAFAVIEQQTPRPTRYRDGKGGWKSSILKSTCVLYSNYMQIRMCLIALDIPFETVTPTKWQSYFGLKKKKGEGDNKWKNRIKAKAQELYPESMIDSGSLTLATSDSLLIATYCQDKKG